MIISNEILYIFFSSYTLNSLHCYRSVSRLKIERYIAIRGIHQFIMPSISKLMEQIFFEGLHLK